MKTKVVLSAFTGFLFGLIGYFVLLLLDIDQSFQLAALSGLLFALLMFSVLIVYGNIMDKRYAKFEKEISSPIFYKTNGNFNLGNGKIKNGRIYFCKGSIVFVSLEEKPYIMEEIPRSSIAKIQCDNIHFNVITCDNLVYIITMPDARVVFKKLKEKDWIIQI